MSKAVQFKEKMLYSLELYKEQENRLNSLLQKKPAWIVASSDWLKLTEQFEYLHEKDAELKSLADIYRYDDLQPEILDVADRLRDCIMRVKQGMDLVYLRIAGEQKIVANRLKKVVKGFDISGYKAGFNYKRSPETAAGRTDIATIDGIKR